jgi:hypothetical protein
MRQGMIMAVTMQRYLIQMIDILTSPKKVQTSILMNLCGYNDGYDACSSETGNSDSVDGTSRCFNEGYEDGIDNPFDRDTYDECGGSSGGPGNNEYYNGFVAGCLSVKGNTAEICEGTTDS